MVKSLRKKSGKKSRKSKSSKLKRSKSHHCKHGFLKTPVRDAKTGRMRNCKKRRSQKYGGNKGELRRSAKKDYSKSRKKARKSSRKRKCKYGMLKTPVRLSSGRMRYCKLKKKSTKKKSKSKRKSSRKSSRKRKCKHGELKNPVRLPSGRMRYCKLKKKKSAKKSRKKSRAKKKKKSRAKSSRFRMPTRKRKGCTKYSKAKCIEQEGCHWVIGKGCKGDMQDTREAEKLQQEQKEIFLRAVKKRREVHTAAAKKLQRAIRKRSEKRTTAVKKLQRAIRERSEKRKRAAAAKARMPPPDWARAAAGGDIGTMMRISAARFKDAVEKAIREGAESFDFFELSDRGGTKEAVQYGKWQPRYRWIKSDGRITYEGIPQADYGIPVNRAGLGFLPGDERSIVPPWFEGGTNQPRVQPAERFLATGSINPEHQRMWDESWLDHEETLETEIGQLEERRGSLGESDKEEKKDIDEEIAKLQHELLIMRNQRTEGGCMIQ